MRDDDIVAAIVAHDPDGLAEAYDKYATGLYGYCRLLLREPADAADAVQDTFVIAASKAADLRDPSRLRPWLYAVARNECHRRLRAGNVSAILEETTYVVDPAADVSHQAERAQLRELVHAAISGLNPGDQEVIELTLRHELQGDDLADALGVPRNHAHALLSRARHQLSTSLGALLVARGGRQSCPALDDLLRGWDGTMTVLMRKRVSRHIEHCEVCGKRKRLELRPAMLLGFAPPLAMLPSGLRDQVLSLCLGGSPEALVQRTGVVHRAGSFGSTGFPVPLDPPKGARWRPSHRQLATTAGAATVAAVVIAVVTVLATSGAHGRHSAGSSAGGPASPARPPAPTAQPSSPGTRHATGPQPVSARGPGGTALPGAASSPASAAGALGTGARSSGGTAGSGGSGGGSGSGSTGGGAGPGGTGTGTGSGGSGSGTGPGTSPPTVNGPVSVTPGLLVLASVLGGPATGTLTLTAGNVPVTHYAISIPSSLVGQLSVSPASGSIGAGQSTEVTVTLSGLLSVDTTITVNPGGHSVRVLLSASVAATRLGLAAPGAVGGR